MGFQLFVHKSTGYHRHCSKWNVRSEAGGKERKPFQDEPGEEES